LTAGETRLAGTLNALPNVTNRTWEYWTLRLGKTGGLPPRAAAKSAARRQARRRAASAKSGTSRRTSSRGNKSRKKGTS